MEGSGVGSGGCVVHFDVHFYAVKSTCTCFPSENFL